MRGRGAAAEYFAQVDEARSALEVAERDLELGPPRRGGMAAGGLCDPVLARALFDADAEMRAAQARKALDEAAQRIGWLRKVYTRKADVLELRHLRGMTWEQAAGELGVSPQTARKWRAELLDWVDSFGWARARLGQGTAEG